MLPYLRAACALSPPGPSNCTALQEQYASEPEAWFIRRGGHIALEVEDFEEAEAALRRHGVEYSRHVLPGGCVVQGINSWPQQWRRGIKVSLHVRGQKGGRARQRQLTAQHAKQKCPADANMRQLFFFDPQGKRFAAYVIEAHSAGACIC
jgi:hypothetical protein